MAVCESDLNSFIQNIGDNVMSRTEKSGLHRVPQIDGTPANSVLHRLSQYDLRHMEFQ